MREALIAWAIGLLFGGICAWLRVPVPAPPSIVAALTVVAVTIGYLIVSHFA